MQCTKKKIREESRRQVGCHKWWWRFPNLLSYIWWFGSNHMVLTGSCAHAVEDGRILHTEQNFSCFSIWIALSAAMNSSYYVEHQWMIYHVYTLVQLDIIVKTPVILLERWLLLATFTIFSMWLRMVLVVLACIKHFSFLISFSSSGPILHNSLFRNSESAVVNVAHLGYLHSMERR